MKALDVLYQTEDHCEWVTDLLCKCALLTLKTVRFNHPLNDAYIQAMLKRPESPGSESSARLFYTTDVENIVSQLTNRYERIACLAVSAAVRSIINHDTNLQCFTAVYQIRDVFPNEVETLIKEVKL